MTSYHLILQGDLNQYGNLFGGRAMEWADVQGFICASLEFPSAQFVTRHFEPFNFISPAKLGDILKIESNLKNTGETSITITIQASNERSHQLVFATECVYVNVIDGVKTPIRKNHNTLHEQGVQQ